MAKIETGLGIISYNGPYRLEDLILSIKKYTKYDKAKFHTVVIDDGSREENLIKYRQLLDPDKGHKIGGKQIYFREHRQNLGISVGWNHCVQSFGEFLPEATYNVLINDDIIVTPHWLESMVYFLKNNKCGGAGLPLLFGSPHDDKAVIMRPDANKNINAGPDAMNIRPGRVMAAPGCLFGFRRDVYDMVGGFDELYKSFYEEIDYGTKCAEKGYPSYALSWPRVWHQWGATFAQNPELEAGKRMSQSRMAYIKKWGGDHPVTHKRYMSEIPPQVIKWYTPYGNLESADLSAEEFRQQYG